MLTVDQIENWDSPDLTKEQLEAQLAHMRVELSNSHAWQKAAEDMAAIELQAILRIRRRLLELDRA